MKKCITVDQLETLSFTARERLHAWFENTYEHDGQNIHVYIPEERYTEYSSGEFTGTWGTEHEFEYPESYVGETKNHKGTILPMMDITLLWQFLEDHKQYHPQQACDDLWIMVRAILEKA